MFKICNYSKTVRLMPKNLWLAIIENDNLIFNSWDGMTRKLFADGQITEKQVTDFFNNHKND